MVCLLYQDLHTMVECVKLAIHVRTDNYDKERRMERHKLRAN